MTHSAVCKQSTLKAPSGKYAQLVYDSTIQFHESLEPVLSALHRRSIGLTKCANYDAALHDANLMQQLSPYSVLGYLCEATIYSEQGKQLDVIDICDQGLSMIDTMDTHYDTLQQLKTDAEQHLSKKIDFVSQLPIEIVIAKLIPLFMDDSRVNPLRPNPYLHVSNVWRDRIVQCFDGLCFNLEKIKEDPGVETRSEITRFAQHTTALSVCLDGQTTWLGDLLCENDYCSLQKLCVLKSSDEGTTIDDFISSLKSVRSTVTDLDVGTGWTSIHLSLSQAVLTFSNLVSLDLRFNGRVDVSALPMTTWPKLTTLTIYKADKEITHDEVVGICKRFPSLKTLELQPCQDIDAALLIPQYYPWMKSLTLIDNVFNIQCRFYNKAQCHDGDDDGRDGITEFLVSEHGNEPGTLTTIDAFLKQHRTTLANMRWDLYHDSDVEHTHDIQYPRLKKLSVVKSGWWIPRNAPQLEELRIAWITITGYHDILDIIPPNLKKLVLDLEHKQPHEDDTILLNYLTHRPAFGIMGT
ncbi:predicted protein [Lichtheimia corymbifera JMRC:FSU:9682]|uniref:F-box domain-containing protein n=1 Tax=Lichtheimia corymbifera JMRC:FSU:9682 TaxID=1263082 RepID=A0A068S731_9FUNG|nr:predicted protein [Lichtheimia corymbifera JMRC:FSU:9682]